MAGKVVMVTGGCGFIGSHLVHRLLADGARRVVVLDSLRCGSVENLGDGDLPEQVELVRFDLGTDPEQALASHLEGVQVLFHLAAEKHNQARHDPAAILRANVDGTAALFRLAARQGVERTVFTSSLYAYGRTSGSPFHEDEPMLPATVYGISKFCGERLLDFETRHSAMTGVVLRFLFVYGPRQLAGAGYRSVIVKNFQRIRAGERPLVLGDGRQALDYVFVDDVVEAVVRCAEEAAAGETFNVGSGKATSVNELTAAMLRVAGSALEPLHAQADETAGTHRVGDITRIRSAVGWVPRIGLEEGLQRTWDWVRGAMP